MLEAVRRFVREFNRGQNVGRGDQHYRSRSNVLQRLFRVVRMYGRRKH